jgi:peptide/nickel transport system permease protein
MPIRYGRWLGNFIIGDFGESIRFKTAVSDVLLPRLKNTGILAAVTLAIVTVLGLSFGVLAGMNEGSLLDRTISIFSIITTSIPEFASAVLLTAIFVFYLDLLPGTSGMTSIPYSSCCRSWSWCFTTSAMWPA